MKISGVILAAGKGTRMKSSLPKVLQPVLGKPMISYAQTALTNVDSKYVILGHESDSVREHIFDDYKIVDVRILDDQRAFQEDSIEQVEKNSSAFLSPHDDH